MTDNSPDESCTSVSEVFAPWPAQMRLLDASLKKAAENLAYDEVLLDDAEHSHGADTLRIWESPEPFVVLGVSQILREHVREESCTQDGVRVLRRGSAGGCVLQGPGCINYTLVLSHKNFPDISTIRGSYCFILNRLAAAFRRRGINAAHKGISDLAVGGHKISGNAQRRSKHCILHHGTILYGMDPELMERYLLEPADRPQYRGARTHRGFVRPLELTAAEVRAVFIEAFGAPTKADKPSKSELEAIHQLAREKYLSPAWIYRR